MVTNMDPVQAAEAGFFDALLAGDANALDSVLASDFLLVDVMRGGEVDRATLIDLVGSGALRFLEIDHAPPKIRHYGEAAIATGTTQMRMRFGPEEGTAHSRYTHVFVLDNGAWRLATAQGTLIADETRP